MSRELDTALFGKQVLTLLRQHDSRTSKVGSPDSWYPETVCQTSQVVCTLGFGFLDLVEHMTVVEISGGDDRVLSKSEVRTEGFLIVTVLHEPTWRLWCEPDTAEQWEGRKESGTQLESPGDLWNVFDDTVCRVTKENTCDAS